MIQVDTHVIELFGNGGLVFWLLTSSVLAIFYLGVIVLPMLLPQNAVPACVSVPNRPAFFKYAVALLCVYLVQAVGVVMLLYKR